MGKRGPKPRTAAEHIARGSYRACRHGPRPQEIERGPSAWDLLALPEPPVTDAELPQEEREAAALERMGWKLPG